MMRASSASFGLSLKKSFILIDFIEKPQFHIQMQKKNNQTQKKHLPLKESMCYAQRKMSL